MVFALGIFLRVYRLGSIPPSPSLDEVSIGYNAYSLLKTGMDEYGNRFPILLRAYDDWRPALYVYTVIPFVWLFGLNAVAVRLPSVLLSLLTLGGTYVLAKELFRSNKLREWIAFFSLLLLAISPWHMYLSRLGHEVNLGLTLVVFGLLLYLRNNLLLSGILFALSLYAYQSEKIITPVLVIFLAFLYRRMLLQHKKKVIAVAAVCTLLIVPLLWATVTSPGLIRFQGTSVLREPGSLSLVASQYISHFRPEWLFAGTAREAHKVPNFGLLYVWEAPLLLLGLFLLWRWRVDLRMRWIILLWILAAPIPAAITTQAPHAMRSYTFLPMLQILGGFGLAAIATRSRYILLALLLLIAASLQVLNKQYFDIFPKSQSDSFQYALGKAIPKAFLLSKDYDQIIISNKDSLYQSYMFYLFYTVFDPALYQRLGGTSSGGYAETHTIGKYLFRPIDWNKDQSEENALLVGNISDFPQQVKALATFQNLDGTDAIKIVAP